MNKVAAFLFAFSAFCSSARAQVDSALAADLQFLLDSKISGLGLEGVTATIIFPGECVWTGMAGESSPGNPVDSNKYWNSGSVGKSLTTAVILQLHEEGLLDINDPIGDYLGTDTISSDIDSTLTIKQLLNHTTDLNDTWSSAAPSTPLWNDVWADRDSVWNLRDVASSTYFVGTTSNPNQEHRYEGHVNFLLAGWIAENASGQTLDQLFQTRLYTPLGMDETYSTSQGYDVGNMNGIYNNTNWVGALPYDSYFSTRGGNGIFVSSSWDVAKFIRGFYKGSLHNSSTLDMAVTKTPGTTSSYPGAIPNTCAGTGQQYYGLGTHVVEFYPNGTNDTIFMVGHGGQGLGNTLAFHIPDNDLTVVMMTNDYSIQAQGANLFMFSDLYCAAKAALPTFSCSIGEEEFAGQSPKIYPNPGHDQLIIEGLEGRDYTSVEVYSARAGRVVETDHPTTSVEYATSEWPKGVYFIVLRYSGGVETVRWIKY
ncbi:MAG: hypothetical protein SchgKO_16240 [Schleiferiaceae bacterium]